MSILVVDDDAAFLEEATNLFKKCGYAITTAKDGKAGLEAFVQGKFALVLVDALLPKMTGDELVREILKTKRGSQAACLLISGIYKQRTTQTELQEKSKAAAFISKPLTEDKVRMILRDHYRVEAVKTSEFSLSPGNITSEMRLSQPELGNLLRTGSLKGVSPFKIVWLLHHHKKTGILTFSKDKWSLTLHFTNGVMGHVESSEDKHLFGQLLVAQGLIRKVDLEGVINEARPERLGKQLVERCLISPHVVDEIMYFQQFERLGSLADRKFDRFVFMEEPPPKNDLEYSFTLFEILSEIVFTRISYDLLKSWAKDLRLMQIVPVRGAAPPSEWKINRDDQQWLTRALGSRGVAKDVLRAFPGGEEKALRYLFFLDILDLVRFSVPGQGNQHAQAAEKLALEFEDMDYFERLGLTRNATVNDVRERFKIMSKDYHPDALNPATDPRTMEAYRRVFHLISEAYEALNEDSALARYKKFGKLVRGDDVMKAEDAFNEGKRNFQRKNYGVARQNFERAFQINPEDGVYLAYICWCELFLIDPSRPGYAEAIESIKKRLHHASELSPATVVPTLVLGAVYKQLGDLEKAESAFRDALDIDPDNRDAQRELRLITMREAQKDKGLKVFGIKIK